MFDYDLFFRHPNCPSRKRHRDDHRKKFGSQADGEGHAKTKDSKAPL